MCLLFLALVGGLFCFSLSLSAARVESSSNDSSLGEDASKQGMNVSKVLGEDQ